MKRILLPLLMLSVISTLSARADLIWYEGFDYADGPINITGTNIDGSTNWFNYSGNSDAMVANHMLENAASGTGTALNRSGDNYRPFCTSSCSYTSAPTVLYFSFTVNSTNFADADGGYFAHVALGAVSFNCKIFGLLSPGLPNTWQLGVSASNNTANVVFPADLATNVDYQVVVEWDPVSLYAASLWVNPISSADPKVISNDALLPITASSFNFRQPSGMGDWFCTITNLAVATTFEEAATNVWTTNAVSPIIAYQPIGGTNFVGDAVVLSSVAAGQGQGSLIYDWYKNGTLIPNPNLNSNAFTIFSALASDSGNYRMVATTPFGLSVTSSVASLWVTNPPVPPSFTQQPTNTTVYFGQTATMKAIAVGVQPITYQWYFTNGTPVPASANFSGETTDTLSIRDVRANNGTAVAYYCIAGNPFGNKTSSTGVVSAVSAPAATIGELRTMVDSTFFLPTNTTALWTVTGIVTTYTNITTSANSSFYMQDSGGGINVFFNANTNARPVAGDSVTVVGPLGQFNSLLELNLTSADPAHSVITNSSGNPLPAAAALPFSFTNSPSASNAIRFYQSALVTLTNVYFPQGFSGANNFGSGVNVVVTNIEGATFNVRVDSRVFDIIGRRVPPYGWTVTGPMGFFLGATATDRSAGFQLLPTRFADIVSQMPASVTYSGGNPVVTWLAGPHVPYSVWRATAVDGAYDSLATGLVFGTTAGTYTDTTAPAGNAFYKITSP